MDGNRKLCPWRLWMFRVALCLESNKPSRAEAAAVLRTLGAASAQNTEIDREQGEAALLALEVRCSLRSKEDGTN